jgi:CDP-glucose 4,6-dehydratase
VFDCYKGKTVLVTGHTGFKGSWLIAWLQSLGAKVVGMALDPPTQPCHFDVAELAQKITDHRVDIRDLEPLLRMVETTQPDFVFHLAAQPLVRQAYQNPLETYTTNVLGTIHMLEALRSLSKKCNAVFITSDKCYDNVEWVWGYRETDALGGEDPYSASKGAAEIAIRSYVKSYFCDSDCSVRIAVGRAGNVIGGGDWASDRIVPDCVRAWSEDGVVELRNPKATRPWQHVLEPLSGYLVLGAQLATRVELNGEPFNFGPPAHQNHTVLELVEAMGLYWEQVRWEDVSKHHDGPYESGLLKLNCDKGLFYLRWQAVLGFEDTVRMTTEWYRYYYQQLGRSMLDFTLGQVAEYTAQARRKGLTWAQ